MLKNYLLLLVICLIPTACTSQKRYGDHQTPGTEVVVLVFILDFPYYEVFKAEYSPARKRVEPKRQMGASKSLSETIQTIQKTLKEDETIHIVWTVPPPILVQTNALFSIGIENIEVQPIPENIEVYGRFHVR